MLWNFRICLIHNVLMTLYQPYIVGGLDESNFTYKALSTAYNLGTLLKEIGNIFVNDCIKQKRSDRKQDAEGSFSKM